MRNHRFINIIVSLLTLILPGVGLTCAAQPPANPSDDFVKASVVIASPGEALYSCTGHAFIRMQCPSQNMDFCFTYESEPIPNKVLTFLGGGLKMGMMAIPTAEFLSSYREEGRSVTEYALNLPIRVKQNLWRVLDNRVDEGMNLPYDYIERGCAITILHNLEEALGSEEMVTPFWPATFSKTRREIFCSEIGHAPWTLLVMNVLTNGSFNQEVENKEKAITPSALVELLQNSRIGDKPVISTVPHELEPLKKEQKAGWFTPMLLALILLSVTIAAGLTGSRLMLWTLLIMQAILGVVNVYLVFCSSLCATEWSWLLIPFNPLPLIFVKWRRIWEIPYAAIIAVWIVAMIIAGHSLTDMALVVLALATAVSFVFDRLLPEGIRAPKMLKSAQNKLSIISNS